MPSAKQILRFGGHHLVGSSGSGTEVRWRFFLRTGGAPRLGAGKCSGTWRSGDSEEWFFCFWLGYCGDSGKTAGRDGSKVKLLEMDSVTWDWEPGERRKELG